MDRGRQMTVYEPAECAVFRLSRGTHGHLSNMTGRMPLRARGMWFQSSEGLYQALKYPEAPHVQRQIGEAASGMAAKQISRDREREWATPFEIWRDQRDDAMRITLAIKLALHPDSFGRSLLATGARPIVEESRHDDYWGASRTERGLVGENRLGKLLMELREMLMDRQDHTMAARDMTQLVTTDALMINGQPALQRHTAETAR